MQTAGYLIRSFVKFTTGMQHGQYNLKGRFALFLMNIYRNTTAIVGHRNGIVFVDDHIDICTISCQSFIDRVVNDFIYQVV